jgi:cytochrome c6
VREFPNTPLVVGCALRIVLDCNRDRSTLRVKTDKLGAMYASRSTQGALATSSGVWGRVTQRSRASSRPARGVARDASETAPPTGAIAAIATGIILTTSPVWAFDGDAAGAFSSRGCVGCHAAGGNVVSASATLFSRDLERNGLTSKEGIARVIELGKGKMPGYGETCAPKGACTFGARLNAEEIDALATFVLERAGEDWK